jgi:hypothetical protein
MCKVVYGIYIRVEYFERKKRDEASKQEASKSLWASLDLTEEGPTSCPSDGVRRVQQISRRNRKLDFRGAYIVRFRLESFLFKLRDAALCGTAGCDRLVRAERGP